ncbi:MAG: hypothetical protein HY402_05030 [Elusimicrobia bacterium]|nr:hypothetical protein [Elusimicrobiota bacterium]
MILSRSLNIKALILAFLAALSIGFWGYTFGTDANLDQILPFVHKINNPALYPNDPYVDTLSTFPSFYPHIIAWMARIFPLAPLHFVLYAALKYLLLLIVFNLAQSFFSNKMTSYLACFLFAFSPLNNIFSLLGDDPLFKTALFQTPLAGVLALAAIYFFLRRRYVASFLIVGSIYYIQGLTANFLLVMFGFASWPAISEKDRKAGERLSLGLGWAAFFLLWLPWLVMYFNRPGPAPASSTQLFVSMLKAWYPGHYFPSLWGGAKWTNLAAFIGLFSIFFHKGFPHSKASTEIKLFLVAMATMWCVAFVVGELVPVPSLILLQFFRSDVFFVSLGLIFAADYIRRLIETQALREVCWGALLVFVLVEFSGPRHHGAVMILLVLWLFLNQTVYRFGLLACLALCLYNSMVHPVAFKKVALASGLLTTLFVAKGRHHMPSWFSSNLAVFLAAFVNLLPYHSLLQYRIQYKQFDNKSEIKRDWEDLGRWVKEHTPVESLFLSPPYMNGFRVYSQRSPYVEWIDAAAMHWARGYENGWVERMAQLGFWGETLGSLRYASVWHENPSLEAVGALEAYERINEDQLLKFSNRHGVDYVVTEHEKSLHFPAIYQNKSFSLYRIAPY